MTGLPVDFDKMIGLGILTGKNDLGNPDICLLLIYPSFSVVAGSAAVGLQFVARHCPEEVGRGAVAAGVAVAVGQQKHCISVIGIVIKFLPHSSPLQHC